MRLSLLQRLHFISKALERSRPLKSNLPQLQRYSIKIEARVLFFTGGGRGIDGHNNL
jgi:hypothetical protein